jgi:hydroxymethylbilane synthase
MRILAPLPETLTLRLGTRQSPLALAQTRLIIERLKAHPLFGAIAFEIVPILSTGDTFLKPSLQELSEKRGGRYGLFVKELEQALLANKIDVAVHSLKDMASYVPEGLVVQAVAPRESVRDAFISADGVTPFFELPAEAVIGTSSARRMAQLKRLRPDIQFHVLRGNVQTRLQKTRSGLYAGIVLAEAGLKRVDLAHYITHTFCPEQELVPAVGQGVLALEFQETSIYAPYIRAVFQDERTEACMVLERALMKTLEGGCQLPLGCYAFFPEHEACKTKTGHEMALTFRVQLLSPCGTHVIERRLSVPYTFGKTTHEQLQVVACRTAEDILARGGAAIRAMCQSSAE